MGSLNSSHSEPWLFHPSQLATVLFQQLGLANDCKITVALSGGADSTALLVALHEIAINPDYPITLNALHFNHRIHADSNQWQSHCATLCKLLGVELQVGGAHTASPRAMSEARARSIRYQWFKNVLQPHQVLMTAHHLDDQVETILMALCQGRGLHRMSGIAQTRQLDFGDHRLLLRPLLGFGRSALQQYLVAKQFAWIQDPTNNDLANDRNFLRHAILPGLRNRWAQLDNNVARVGNQIQAAWQQAEAKTQCLLAEATLRAAKSVFCLAPPLSIDALMAMRQSDRQQVIRQWLHFAGYAAPAERPLKQFCGAIGSRQIHRQLSVCQWNDVQIRSYQNRLYLLPLHISTDNVQIQMRPVKGGGLNMALYQAAQLLWQQRLGGEKFSRANRAHRSSLKTLLQQAAVPPWERAAIPLLMLNGEIAWAHGIGCSKKYQVTATDEVGLLPVPKYQKPL